VWLLHCDLLGRVMRQRCYTKINISGRFLYGTFYLEESKKLDPGGWVSKAEVATNVMNFMMTHSRGQRMGGREGLNSNAHKGWSHRKRPPGNLRHGCENNSEMDLTDIVHDKVNWSVLAQNRK